MGKTRSKIGIGFSRALKIVVVAALLPIAMGLVGGVLAQLETINPLGTTARQAAAWGLFTYVGIHLILYRPMSLFRMSHRMFSAIAVWLFGGQVASVEAPSEGRGKHSKRGSAPPETQGSALVAFSPYVIPVYTMWVCGAGWAARRWWDPPRTVIPIAFLVGFTMAFHWVMTADELQPQREQWHAETYLLAVLLVFLVTLLIGSACLPWAAPEFSVLQALLDGWDRARNVYSTAFHRLFLP